MNVIIMQCLLTRLRYLREIVRKQGRTQEERGKGAKGHRKNRQRHRMTDTQRDREPPYILKDSIRPKRSTKNGKERGK